MTLHPLGVLDEGQTQAVAEALQWVRLPAFQFELDWTGVWTRNRIAVACARPDAALAQLHDACASALGSSLRSSAWLPHVTLARNALGAGAELIEPLRWPVEAFWLVRSWIRPRASRHEVLRCYPLAGASAGPAESNPCAAQGLPDRLWSAPPLGLR
ncbi:2'-5' RNA ligase family protein [Xenophilus aerolatus]|nr:2'-5' RNA ligase family protein [Xenophilus aerolatus]